MIQNTTEKFLLLIQHPKKSRFVISDQVKNAGLIGSILLDLFNDRKIDIEKGKLKFKSIDTDLPSAHKHVLEQIQKSSKNRKIKTWVSKLARKSRKYLKEILLELENKGIIKIEYKKFVIFKYYRTRLININIREQIINEIRDVIFNDKQINNEKSLILGLIEACKLYKIICKDKKERKICKTKVKAIIKSDAISQGVDKAIKEMQAAIAGAVAGATAAAVAASS